MVIAGFPSSCKHEKLVEADRLLRGHKPYRGYKCFGIP
jgi:hypothetical protein